MVPINEIISDCSTATRKEKKKETCQEKLKSSKTAKGVLGPTKGNPLSIIFVGDVSFIFHISFFKNHKIKDPSQVGEASKAKHPERAEKEACQLGHI